MKEEVGGVKGKKAVEVVGEGRRGRGRGRGKKYGKVVKTKGAWPLFLLPLPHVWVFGKLYRINRSSLCRRGFCEWVDQVG